MQCNENNNWCIDYSTVNAIYVGLVTFSLATHWWWQSTCSRCSPSALGTERRGSAPTIAWPGISRVALCGLYRSQLL